MDAKARLTEIIGNTRHNAKVEEIVDTLLAEGVTLPEPVQAGPVTSEEAVIAYEVAYNSRRNGYLWFDPAWRIDGRHSLDAAMPLLARDHGLLTPAEVERRARAWADDYNLGPAHESALIAALTAPEGEK